MRKAIGALSLFALFAGITIIIADAPKSSGCSIHGALSEISSILVWAYTIFAACVFLWMTFDSRMPWLYISALVSYAGCWAIALYHNYVAHPGLIATEPTFWVGAASVTVLIGTPIVVIADAIMAIKKSKAD